MSNDSVSDRTKHIDIRHRWISSFVPDRIYVGHVPTEHNCSDILTKNTTEATFIKHAKTLINGDIKCYIDHQKQSFTREDVELGEVDSWTPVLGKKKNLGTKGKSWSTKNIHSKESPRVSKSIMTKKKVPENINVGWTINITPVITKRIKIIFRGVSLSL